MRNVAIVLAAGQGKRMNSKVAKQYLLLEDKPILYYSLKEFEENENIHEIILVVGNDEIEYCRNNIINKYNFNKITHIKVGGKERYHSVFNGLSAIKEADYVLIHDGARPFLTDDIINRTIEALKKDKAVVVAMPVKDTIKIADDSNFVESTPMRNKVWAIQTPQAFDFTLIKEAYDKLLQNEISVTDDAMVVELMLGYPIKLILGSYNNIKITTPEDTVLAKVIKGIYNEDVF